jgi:release factor glutamine methyltransferase
VNQDSSPRGDGATGSFAGSTIETARRSLAARLRANAIESAELDARLLVSHVLDLDLTAMIASAGRRIASAEAARLEDLAQRRLAGEPVARILGAREFWGLPLQLSPATLVPRPDTETVVERALEMLHQATNQDRALRIADIGTGSGAILLALLSELPNAYGIGTDISLAALETAHDNAVHLGLARRAAFVACDYAAALAGPFDLIVSNPPYIRSAEIANLATEVRDHDPRRALDGGSDGLNAYRALIPEVAGLLGPEAALVLEVGQGQSDAVENLIRAAGLISDQPAKPDIAGIPRAVSGRRVSP